MAPEDILKQVRQKIKYVFVIYQENRSFDSYFGTFPGAEGIYSHRSSPGFTQFLTDTRGHKMKIQPFRIGPKQFAADTDDVDHSHAGIIAKMDIQSGQARMDRFAQAQEDIQTEKEKGGKTPSLKAMQFGELTMAYEDCDTVPLLWAYAHKFVLFDHIFQLMAGPSTPGNLSIIGAQTGVTQWALHPDQAYKGNADTAPGVPVLNDNDPFWGSQLDTTPADKRMPVKSSQGHSSAALNLTYATLPLTLLGGSLGQVAQSDWDPAGDLKDVKDDVSFISRLNSPVVTFGWYEEGYDKESTDADDAVDADGTHASYVTHHNGPQYFGYISNNPKMRSQLHGLDDFLAAIKTNTLTASGGVFYLKGGYRNQLKLVSTDPDPKVRMRFVGDDDHPGYSDSQISEAMVAEAINQIAVSRYWPESAIIITWDDSEGDYDHVPPPLRVKGPDGSFISDGPRVPLIFISPYARTRYVAHAVGNHASVVKFIDAVFSLPPLALLPDEYLGRKLGEREFGQSGLGPQDALTPDVTDLLGAFSPSRLMGNSSPLPPSYAMVPERLIRRLPQATGYGCKGVGIIPIAPPAGIKNKPPLGFNPRPNESSK